MLLRRKQRISEKTFYERQMVSFSTIPDECAYAKIWDWEV
jgi:hypothetical protein